MKNKISIEWYDEIDSTTNFSQVSWKPPTISFLARLRHWRCLTT